MPRLIVLRIIRPKHGNTIVEQVISELEARFSSQSVTCCTLLSLFPSILCVQEVDIADAVEIYSDDLQSTELLYQEMRRWKMK